MMDGTSSDDSTLARMIKRSAGLLALVLFPSVAIATGEAPPEHVFGIYANRVNLCFPHSGCEGETLNYVLVAPRANRGVGVRIELAFAAGHTCQFDQNGEWVHDRVVVRMFDQHQDEKECRLELLFKGENVVLNDIGDHCRISTCGARGGYTGMELPKRGAF
jgi:hypothetical protein